LNKRVIRGWPSYTIAKIAGFYSGSYPPNCWRGIFTLVPILRETLNWPKDPPRRNKKSIWAVDTHTCQQKLSLPHKKGQEKQTHWNHTKQEGTGQGQQVAEVKGSKGLKLSCQLSKAQA
jgi:hypothetical protein